MNAEQLAEHLDARRAGDGWSALCPAHEDRNPSLSINDGLDGGTVVHCHAGCAPDAVMAALGLSLVDLAPPSLATNEPPTSTYPYVDERGELLYEVLRRPGKKFSQRPASGRTGAGAMQGVRTVLYRLPAVQRAIEAGNTVFIVEGEKDADAMAAAGWCATTNPMGAGKWHKVAQHAREVLAGADVIVVRDRDEPGARHAAQVVKSLRGVAGSVLLVEAVEGKDVSDHLAAGHTVEELVEVSAPPDTPAPRAGVDDVLSRTMFARTDESPIQFLTVDDARRLPPTQPLVEGVLDLDSMAILYGRRGSYKSFLALDWALSVANGTRWQHKASTYGPVVYVVAEGLSGFVQRIDAWRAHHPGHGDGNLLLYPQSVNLLSPSSVGPFAEECARVGARLVVIDTLSRCFVGGEENGGKDGSVGVEQVDSIRKRTGACVLLVHHAGKDADKGSRGWSGWEAAADDVWSLEATHGDVTLRCTKRKNHPEPRDQFFTATASADSIVLTAGGPADRIPAALIETLRGLVAADAGNGVPAGQWEVSSDVARRTFYRHRADLLRLGLVHNVGTDKMPRYQATPEGSATCAKEVSQ